MNYTSNNNHNITHITVASTQSIHIALIHITEQRGSRENEVVGEEEAGAEEEEAGTGRRRPA